MYQDRRKFHRIPVHVISHYKKEEYDQLIEDFSYSFIKDISCHGMRAIIPVDIKRGERIISALDLPTSCIPVLVHGEVVWAARMMVTGDKGNKSVVTEAGVKFVHLSEIDANKLEKFITVISEEMCEHAHAGR